MRLKRHGSRTNPGQPGSGNTTFLKYHTQLYSIMVNRTYTFGVRFRKGFKKGMLAKQAGMDRYVYNKLLETFKEEYRRTGRVNATRGRINAWYTDLRNNSGPRWLQQSISGVTRQILYDLGRHYDQYVETERLKAADIKPKAEFGEPHFKKKYGHHISIPLTISHNNTHGSAWFTSERTIKIIKMGELKLSREFPVLNYRYKTAQLFQLPDGRWRITIACEVPDEMPTVTVQTVIGIDRNVGNVATPDCVLIIPEKVARRMNNAEKTASKAQKIASRRQKPDYTNRKPGSKRWAKASKRAAKNKRKTANIRKTISHKISRVISDSTTHTAMENLPIQNIVRSAKGTEEQPGKNVAQKSGLNKAIIQQCWGLLALLLAYKLAGEIIWVTAAYTSQRCNSCGYTHKGNRDGRRFLCKRCGHTSHADCNAGMNIEDMGLEKLGPNAIHGQLKLRESGYADRTQVMGRLDVEGSCVSSLMKRQARTGGRTVVLWYDV